MKNFKDQIVNFYFLIIGPKNNSFTIFVHLYLALSLQVVAAILNE